MRYALRLACVLTLIFSLGGCALIKPFTPPTPEAAIPAKTQTPEETEAVPVTTTQTFHGSYFDIAYPSDFTPRPTAPTKTIDGITIVLTDEAFFTSPDHAVEFFIYSPQWSGEPQDYLSAGENEIMISETSASSATEDNVISRGTVKAKDGSYIRSWESIRDHVTIGSETHRIFGITYRDDAAYNKYKAQYLAFKKSLEQFAD